MSLAIEPAYAVDANALYWYLIGDLKLGPNALAVFRAAERGETEIVISAVVIAELYYIHQKKPLPQDFAATFAALKSSPYVQFADFSADDVLDFAADVAVPEMHDRIIAGLARRLNIPLLTSDPVISGSGLVKITW